MLREWLAVAAGGAVGSLARYALLLLFYRVGVAWLPVATLLANTLGCLAIGWLTQWAVQHAATHQWWVTGVRVGVLGGLTTFSSFALDVLRTWQTDRAGVSILLVCLHVTLGISCVALGMWLAKHYT